MIGPHQAMDHTSAGPPPATRSARAGVRRTAAPPADSAGGLAVGVTPEQDPLRPRHRLAQPAWITGLGTARPAPRLSAARAVAEAVRRCGPDPAMAARVRILHRRVGIRSRACVVADAFDRFYPANASASPTTAERMAAYAAAAPGLATSAAARALRVADRAPADVTEIVVVSCTGFTAPGVDQSVIDRLGLDDSVARTTVGFMGCHGALNGLRVASNAVRADPGAVVLLVAVELCSLHFAYGDDPHDLVANALFADGAAAMVLEGGARRSPETLRVRMSGRPPAPVRRQVLAHGSGRIAGTEDLMGWRIGDHGFRMTLEPEVPAMVERSIAPWIDEWLGRQGLDRRDVGRWIVHPGGPKILDAVERGLALGPDALAASRDVLRRCGNMSSPTVLFVLRRSHQRTDAASHRPGPAVVIGLGPGLAIEAALIE